VADSPEQVDSNVRQLLTRLADRPGRLKTRLSEVGMSTDELKITLENYRVDEQAALYQQASAESRTAGCLPTALFLPGLILLATGIPVAIGCGLLTWVLALRMFGKAKEKGFGYSVENEFEAIALDLLKYALSDNERPDNPPSRYIADANDAEHAAAEFMQWLGFLDAQATPVGPDGGVDVWSSDAIGQVKDYGTPIGRPEIQQHLGVAIGEGDKLPIFFARSGYTNQALEWANERDMPLYAFDLAGSFEPSNLAAQRLWLSGAKPFLKTLRSEKQGTRLPNQETTTAPSSITEGSLPEPPAVDSEPDDQTSAMKDESSGGLVAELRELADLRDSGVLDEDEFQAAKKKLLN
jgi:hypothetical protein